MNTKHLLRWLFALVGLCVVVASGAWLGAKRPLSQPQLTSQQAAVLALNQISATDAGFELQHQHHSAQFTAEGLHFQALNGPSWRWQLTDATAQDVALGQTAATRPTAARISYHRGALTEQYLIQTSAIEQQFILPEPLTLTADDLILTGQIQSDGTFMTTPNGWAWYIDNTTVELGDVTVFDATGALLPA
ncbi:MAG: hypothetical protein KDE51_22060, partial [Anaerolineales bacterium]|nr:hypothetical protein [Anaerolineales bacterium]